MARHDTDRIRRDQAGVGPDPAYVSDLVSIEDAGGFRIADGEPDIRGWEVCTVAGRKIGEVDDLLIDARRGEVVMLDVELEGTDRHAEVPVRAVQLDRANQRVLVDSGDIDGYAVETRRARLSDQDRERLREEYGNGRARDVRYNVSDDTVEETVVEQRPVVMEEVVVRRRVVDQDNDAT